METGAGCVFESGKRDKHETRSVVIEDAYNGVIAAKTAGMYCHAYVPPQAYRQDVSLANDVIILSGCDGGRYIGE